MNLPRIQVELTDDFLPLAQLRELVQELEPESARLIERWAAAYRRTFGSAGFFKPAELPAHLSEELELVFACGRSTALVDLWDRFQDAGRRHAELGVPYGELVITAGLLEECVIAVLADRQVGLERRLDAYLVFDKFCHFRIAKLAESYFYRYVELIQEKSHELAEEQEKHELSLMRAEKLAGLGQLAGGVAHELNNPLAAISVTVEDLLEDVRSRADRSGGDVPELEHALERIRRSVTRCVDVVGAMVHLTRPTPPATTEFLINDRVREMAEVAALSSRPPDATVSFDLDPGLGLVRTDPGLLRECLAALVSNALDAVAPGGAVEIRTRRRGAYFAIEVEDNGCGIPAHHKNRIFEPFFTTKPPGKGTGLGLSTTHSKAKRLGGKLIIESEPGKGTIARLLLPLTGSRDE